MLGASFLWIMNKLSSCIKVQLLWWASESEIVYGFLFKISIKAHQNIIRPSTMPQTKQQFNQMAPKACTKHAALRMLSNFSILPFSPQQKHPYSKQSKPDYLLTYPNASWHITEAITTHKDHLKRVHKNLRSTKPNKYPEKTFDLKQEDKTCFAYALLDIRNFAGVRYSDLMSPFSYVSVWGDRYALSSIQRIPLQF